MVKFYTDRKFLKKNELLVTRGTVNRMFPDVLKNLDLMKWKDIIIKEESNLCFDNTLLSIDFDKQELTNSFGSCSFRDFGNSWKNFFSYIYLGEDYKRRISDKEFYDDTIEVLDVTNMGNNIMEYLIEEMDKYSLPVITKSLILDFKWDNNKIYYLNDTLCETYWDFFYLYDSYNDSSGIEQTNYF